MIVSKRARELDKEAISFTQRGDVWGACRCGINQNYDIHTVDGVKYAFFKLPFKLVDGRRCMHRALTLRLIRAERAK
jgi:hypothetical protein